MHLETFNCIVVLGPTASGKTRTACALAYHLKGEVISADSRQVYKQLDIGTGKDLAEYIVHGKHIPYHLINISEPGEQVYLHQFAEQLEKVFTGIKERNNIPIICGGTGLYLDALRKDFSLTQIPEDQKLRESLSTLNKAELIERLDQFETHLTNQVDRNSSKRIIRGIEIATYLRLNKPPERKELPYKPYYIGIDISKEVRNEKISTRLRSRIQQGLIEEAQSLVKSGISYERLEFFGLEYKFLSYYLQNKINKEELFTKLEIAIHQFAKRQMTWFRKMEKEGVDIHWIKPDENLAELSTLLRRRID